MDIFKQKPYLAALLIGLILARVFGMPIIEWQNEKYAELLLESKRVQRAERAIQNKDRLEPMLEGLTEKVVSNRQRLFAYKSENAFKLEQQKRIETLVSEHGLRITGIGWLATKQLDDFDMTLYQLEARFSGDGIHFPVLMADLEKQAQWLEIENFTFGFRQQSSTRLGSANGQIIINFYMLNEEQK